MAMLELLSVRDKLPRRSSRRVVLRVREGLRDKPPEEGARSLPTNRYSELDRFQPEQNGQKSHLISHPEIPRRLVQLERLVEGVHERERWYQRWRQG